MDELEEDVCREWSMSDSVYIGERRQHSLIADFVDGFNLYIIAKRST